MDVESKISSWFTNLRQKLEIVVPPEPVNYLKNQLLKAGETLTDLYSEIVEDVFLTTIVDYNSDSDDEHSSDDPDDDIPPYYPRKLIPFLLPKEILRELSTDFPSKKEDDTGTLDPLVIAVRPSKLDEEINEFNACVSLSRECSSVEKASDCYVTELGTESTEPGHSLKLDESYFLVDVAKSDFDSDTEIDYLSLKKEFQPFGRKFSEKHSCGTDPEGIDQRSLIEELERLNEDPYGADSDWEII